MMYKILNKTYTNLPTEADEQKELVKWLTKNKYFFFATNNENNTFKQDRKYAMIAEQKAKANGKLKGVSDLTIFTTNTIIFLELKRQRPVLKSGKLGTPTNKPSKEQNEFIAKVNEFTYAYGCVAFGCDESIKILKGFENES